MICIPGLVVFMGAAVFFFISCCMYSSMIFIPPVLRVLFSVYTLTFFLGGEGFSDPYCIGFAISRVHFFL